MSRICYIEYMNSLIIQKVARPFLIISLLVFFFVGFLGLGHIGMTNAEGQLSNCPLMGMTTLCQMNPLKHIAAWQNLFIASTQKDTLAILILLFLSLLLAFSIHNLWPTRKRHQPIKINSLHTRPKIDTPIIFTPLQEAFSNGILNRKVF